MAENQSGQDKTEDASPKRRQEASEKGNVARSTDLNSVAVLFAGILALSYSGKQLLDTVGGFAVHVYRQSSTINITADTVNFYSSEFIKTFATILGPIFAILLLFGLAINYAQVGVVFAKKAIIPKLEKISPLKGLKRIFSMRSIVELIKGIAKITLVGTVGYFVVKNHLDEYWMLSFSSVGMVISFLAGVLLELAIKIGMALIVIGAADFAYQKYDHEKKLKMTKVEVKEEQKQHDGNPEIKSRLRSAQQQAARSRMLAVIPDATVVVTNTTQIAIALQYDPKEKSDAPKIIAKGKRKLAAKIKALARENDVPVIENKPLARSLFKTTEVGQEIPMIFYEAVAEILAEVYKMNRDKKPTMAA